jgi:hypothetical protein
MDRMFKFVGITVVTAVLLIATAVLAGSIYNDLTPSLAASPGEKVQEASKTEVESRKQVVTEVVDVKAALDTLQGHLDNGNVKDAQSDARRLRTEFRELSEVCGRWDTDLSRLATDGGKLFEEWTILIDSIQDPTSRVREAERLARSKARFHENLQQAESALGQAKEALATFGDVEKVVKSAMDFAPNATSISEGLVALSTSARERSTAFRTATTAILDTIQNIDGSLFS